MHCPSWDDAFVSSFFLLLFYTGWIAAKRETAGIVFYSQAKNQVFRPAGATRCTDSRQT